MADIFVQPGVFVLFAAAGMADGLLYAVVRGFCHISRHSVLTAVSDLFFCVCTFALFAACSLYTLDGGIRFFSIAGFVLGFAAFYTGPGAALCKTVARSVKFTGQLALKAVKSFEQMLAKRNSSQ